MEYLSSSVVHCANVWYLRSLLVYLELSYSHTTDFASLSFHIRNRERDESKFGSSPCLNTDEEVVSILRPEAFYPDICGNDELKWSEYYAVQFTNEKLHNLCMCTFVHRVYWYCSSSYHKIVSIFRYAALSVLHVRAAVQVHYATITPA